MEKQAIIIKESDRQFSVDYWRGLFRELSEKAGDYNRRHLIVYDSYFLTAVGKSALSNVKGGIGGLEPTMRAVKALQKLVAEKAKEDKNAVNRANRQKLVMP